MLRTAVVTSFDARTSPEVLTVRFKDTESIEQVSLVGPDVPPTYRGVAVPFWSKPCKPKAGDDVRVAWAGGLPLAVQERKAPPGDWEACFLRTYFDLSTPSSVPNEVGHALGRSLGLLAQAQVPVSMSIWIRGAADRVLSSYDKPAIVRESASTRGHPELADSVDAIHALRLKLTSHIIVARVTPYRYRSWTEQPVGGGWPYFVISIFEEASDRTLTKIADYSGLIR
jgi:hypothetical protein